jgi:fructose-1,6-bisphosphatase/inositol monophosphatase family enzyme
MSVCAGQAEFWLEPAAKPWDLAVVQVIARESGLRFFDHTGADTIYGGDAILCVPPLEPAAREFLGLA